MRIPNQSDKRTTPTNPGEAWAAHAGELAAWTWARLVNRVDVWGRYGDEGTFTAPAVAKRGAVLLREADVVRHFRPRCRGDILGLHTTSVDNTSRWGAADIDQHADAAEVAAVNLAAAMSWYDRVKSLGFRPLLTTSNGAGGYHLRITFREPVATARVFAFMKWLTRDHKRIGLPAVETFPKQAKVAPLGQPGCYGNWLRLPGRHHKRDHWSQAWDGARWLNGAAAVEWLLSFEGDSPNLIPRDAEPKPPAPLRRCYRPPPTDAGGLERRIMAYMAKVPCSGEGTGRDDRGYHLAAFLVRDLALDDGTARRWLELWDAGNCPPKGEAQISKWIANARAHGRRPIGCGLTNEGGPRP